MDETEKKFRSNGKLLISGEYLVLHGAWSLSVPTIPGQTLTVRKTGRSRTLRWRTKVGSESWLEGEIDPHDWRFSPVSDPDRSGFLIRVLKAAAHLRGDIRWLHGKEAVSELEFDLGWGLGSSSSLISNIAWWADVDPFLLSRSVSRGSGYDIACARSDRPLLYRIKEGRPESKTVSFGPPFRERLAFVYLGKKQDSATSVNNFLKKALVREKDLERISDIPERLSQVEGLDEFEALVNEHDRILSGILGLPAIKRGLFQDYPGAVKSLGAWGGDFVLITLHQDWKEVKQYFSERGLNIIIPWYKMVKTGS